MLTSYLKLKYFICKRLLEHVIIVIITINKKCIYFGALLFEMHVKSLSLTNVKKQ